MSDPNGRTGKILNTSPKHGMESRAFDSGYMDSGEIMDSASGLNVEIKTMSCTRDRDNRQIPQVKEPKTMSSGTRCKIDYNRSDSGVDIGLNEQLSQLQLDEVRSDSGSCLDSGVLSGDSTLPSPDPHCLQLKNSPLGIDEDHMKKLVSDAFKQDQDGDTYLHLAIMQGFVEVVFSLIRLATSASQLNIPNDLGQTPLHLAVLYGEPRIVRRLVLAGGDVNCRDKEGNTPLHLASIKGDLPSLHQMIRPISSLEANSLFQRYTVVPQFARDFNQRNYEGRACIHLAAWNGHSHVLRYLHAIGGDMNLKEGKGGETALHVAIRRGDVRMAGMLMKECGADPRVTDYQGFNALHLAQWSDTRHPHLTAFIHDLIRLRVPSSPLPASILNEDSSSSDDEDDFPSFQTLWVLELMLVMALCFSALGTKTKMYIDIAANITCFRRFNSTSQTGCSSHKDGNVGIVHVVSGREDTNWILTEGGTPPYVPVLYGSTTSPANLTELAWSSRVSAIVILDDLDDTLVGNWINFSSDAKCPNYPFSFYQERDKCTTRNSWNPAGYDLAHLDWPIPVMFLDAQADSDRLVNHCYKTFNKPWNGTGGKLEDRSYPLCALQLTTRMLGAVNTPTCMRRGDGELLLFGGGGDSVQCEPLGGDSIHMPLVPRQKKNFNYTTGSVTIVAARMDTSSLFANIGPGGDSVVTGLVTWMITAHLLSRKEFRAGLNSSNESIHFMLFNGEAWGYIGSSRILYDMAEGSFPEAMDETKEIQPSLMKVEHIKQWIEIGQVSPSSRGNPVLYVHSNAPNDPQVEKMTKLLSNYSNSKIGKANSGVQLPPSSLHSALKANKTIPGILLANFPDSSFQNSFYNGFKEVGKALNFECNSTQISALAQHLTTTAEALASSVYDLITNKGPSFDVSQLINVSTVRFQNENWSDL
ncbi:unnamed protein product [Darwinula stevensoni]|uniref:Nicastrin n=1 Tax=Darwinula stevensoni TaxID=69355 RepID=A0A7R8X4Z9_9CRUS|nr:unnamed protein product [Darwinula stevensoni]CAG0884108.1 unnamed protein product [Darwinula stevensoni]